MVDSASPSASVSSALASSLVVEDEPDIKGLPEFGPDGLYHITNVDEYE